MKRGAENGRPEASFSLPSLPPSLLQSLQVPHSSSFSRSLERAESIDYSAAAASLSTSALCSRLLSAKKDEPNLSLSLCLSGCMYWLRCLAHLLSRSLPLSFRHSFHKFIAQQIACEVSDAQEQKEATDPQREWTLSLSDRAGERPPNYAPNRLEILHNARPTVAARHPISRGLRDALCFIADLHSLHQFNSQSKIGYGFKQGLKFEDGDSKGASKSDPAQSPCRIWGLRHAARRKRNSPLSLTVRGVRCGGRVQM